MGKLQKKAEKGAAANYITRTRAVRKLQLSLADFRRLCILKGIYPREPKNKRKAAGKSRNPNNTFYYVKDINYLLHEPIVNKFREHKVFLKKLHRALAKGQLSTYKALEENEPRYTLDHLVKERYPTFIDAVRDLDDCLCHIFLFATLPASEKIEKRLIDESVRLAAEFQNYVIHSQSLKKVFLSIKGIYYQAEIKGQPVTWIVPYQFSQQIPEDVDFKVMLTFLEFYHTLLSFVNFKLYSDLNIKYPPVLDARMDENGAGLIASYLLQPANESAVLVEEETKEPQIDKTTFTNRLKSLPSKLAEITEDANDDVQDNNDNDSSMEVDNVDNEVSQATSNKQLFSKMNFFLSRECPRYALEFVLRACGATVSWPETSGSSSPFKEDSPKITHQIVDRPLEHLKLRSDRVYIQPQWVFDCVNAGQLLKEDLYLPGKPLPAHHSPFVQYNEGDYVPGNDDNEEEDVSEEEEMTNKVSQVETVVEGEKETAEEKRKKEKQSADKQATEKVEMAKMVMSNKQRRLVERIQKEKAEKTAEVKQLKQKKRLLQQRK